MTNYNPQPPLNAAHLASINEQLRRIQDARQLMDHAEECGVNCQENRQLAEWLESNLTQFKQRFFKNGAPIIPRSN